MTTQRAIKYCRQESIGLGLIGLNSTQLRLVLLYQIFFASVFLLNGRSSKIKGLKGRIEKKKKKRMRY